MRQQALPVPDTRPQWSHQDLCAIQPYLSPNKAHFDRNDLDLQLLKAGVSTYYKDNRFAAEGGNHISFKDDEIVLKTQFHGQIGGENLPSIGMVGGLAYLL